MAITDIKKKKIGRELTEWVFLGIRTGARRAVAEYREQTAAGNTELAVAHIKRAVDLPHRARARITQAVTTYGQPAIVECITAYDGVTLAEINAELTTLETYAQGLVDHVNNDGWTWDQVATDIEDKVANESAEWVFPLPAGYTDVWGE